MGAEWLGGILVFVGIILQGKQQFFIRKQMYFIGEVRQDCDFYLTWNWSNIYNTSEGCCFSLSCRKSYGPDLFFYC